MLTDIVFAPLLPGPWIAVLAALALIPAVAGIARHAAGAWLRLLAALLLTGALLDPRLLRENRRAEPDVAVLVIDDSASQAVGRRAERTRAAVTALRERLDKFANLERREIVVRNIPGQDNGTRLFEALGRALADVPPDRFAGALLVTDGLVHDVPKDKAQLPALGPVHGVISGERGEKDRRLIVENAPAYGVVGAAAVIVVRIEDEPAAPGAKAMLTITPDHGPPMSLTVPVGRPVRIELPVERSGPAVIEMAVDSLAEEISTDNNRAALALNGVRDRLRVLLLSGQPHPGERAWRNLLKSDPAVDLVHFTILRTIANDSEAAGHEMALIEFPVRELFLDKLTTFDLVVFDRFVDPEILPRPYLERVVDYVRGGGAALMALGPEVRDATGSAMGPLGAMLPARPTGTLRETPFRPRLSTLGARHPAVSGLLDDGAPPVWGRWFRALTLAEGEGQTVMEGPDGAPLLVLGRFGEGRTALLASDQLWLWARGYDGGGPYAELIRRLAHWLMKEPELEEEDLRLRAEGTRLIATRQSLGPTPPNLTLTLPDGTSRPLPLTEGANGRAVGAAVVETPGIHRVDDGARVARAAVGGAGAIEGGELRATESRLAPIATASGGGVVWLADDAPLELRRVAPGRPAAGRGWLGLIEHQAYTVVGMRESPLLPALAVLALLLGGLAGAWWREGRGHPI